MRARAMTVGMMMMGLASAGLGGAGCATAEGEQEETQTAATEAPRTRKKKPDKVTMQVVHQAAFDLQCDESQLVATKISDEMMGQMMTYGVRGCGQQGTYKVGCSFMGCTVMAESQVRNLSARQ